MSCVGSFPGSRQPLLFTARGSRGGYGPLMCLYLLYGCLDHSGTVSRPYALPYECMHRARQAATPAGMPHGNPADGIEPPRMCQPGTGKGSMELPILSPSYAMPRPRKKSVFTFCRLPGLTRNIRRRCAGGTDAAVDWTGHTKRKRRSRSL